MGIWLTEYCQKGEIDQLSHTHTKRGGGGGDPCNMFLYSRMVSPFKCMLILFLCFMTLYYHQLYIMVIFYFFNCFRGAQQGVLPEVLC